MNLLVLASSSSGNCTLLRSADTRILIDVGIGKKQLVEQLIAAGERPEEITGIVLTHEHGDHTAGVEIARQFGIPVFLSYGTAAAMRWKGGVAPELRRFERGTDFEVGGLKVQSFPIPHDAADPVGFVFRANGTRFGYATDLGHVSEPVANAFQDCNALFLEANHALSMLQVAPYPWKVRERIMGRFGHLSNEVVADFVRTQMGKSVERLILGHLSQNTNHPEIVNLEISPAVSDRGGVTAEVIEPETAGRMVEL